MDDRGLNSTRDALSDHHKMDRIVESLEVGRHAGADGWRMLNSFLGELHDHLREERKLPRQADT